MPKTKRTFNVKHSLAWQKLWYSENVSDKNYTELPLAPIGRDGDGKLYGSDNYKWNTLWNEFLDVRLRPTLAVQNLLDRYALEEKYGHMLNEELSPSHSSHHHRIHALGLYASRHIPELYKAVRAWWRDEFEIIRFFSCRKGVVAPGARSKRKGKAGLAGRCPTSDQLAKFVASGNVNKLSKDKGVHPDTLLWTLLRAGGIEEALIPPVNEVKLKYPVWKLTAEDGSFVAWLPDDAKKGLEKPQMWAKYNAADNTDSYGEDLPEVWEDFFTSGTMDIIGNVID